MRALLEAGFVVRGQVHSESTGAHLHDLFVRFGSSFETVVVEDLTQVWSLLPRVYSLGISRNSPGGVFDCFLETSTRLCTQIPTHQHPWVLMMVGFLPRGVRRHSGPTRIRFWSSQHRESLSQRYGIRVRAPPTVPGPTPTAILVQVRCKTNYPPTLNHSHHICSSGWRGLYGGGQEWSSNQTG